MLYAGLINNLQNQAEKAFFELETSTKNITNLTTPGYKSERPLSFGDVFNEEYGNYKIQKKMEPGKLNITLNPSDVSLEGKGFFVLSDEHDDTILTRNLSLHLDKDGNLASKDKLIFPKVSVKGSFKGFKVTDDGKVLGENNDGTHIKLTTLRVVNFPDTEKLDFDGEYFRPTEEAGEAQPVCIGPSGQTKVRQFAQEGSNVDVPAEFARFNDVNKKVSTLARLVQLMNSSEREYIRTLTSAIG
jgi:flagellar basal-body rod protein FlgG